MRSDIDYNVIKIKDDLNSDAFKDFLNESKPFILSVASSRLGRYVSFQDDDGYEIAVLAFYDAVKTYEFEKGTFLAYAKTVIDNRLINYLRTESRHNTVSLEDVDIENLSETSDDEFSIKKEIVELENELKKFGIDFNELAENGPKHQDTRNEAKRIALLASEDKELSDFFFEKKRLPVTKMAKRFSVSRKTIYGSRSYIISIMIIIGKDLELLKEWIK